MSPTTNPRLGLKIGKIVRLAFDPSAAEGEAVNAATLLVRLARKNQVGFDDFKNFLGVTAAPPDDPSWLMPFGKYLGFSIAWIFRHNPSYLEWFVREVKGHELLKDRIREFLKTRQN